jgi:hypothetical protein
MLTGRKIRRPPHHGKVPERQRQALDLLEQMTRVQGFRGGMQTPGGVFLPPPGTPMKIGQVDGGGITARSGATLGYGTVNEACLSFTGPTAGTIQLTGNSDVVFNFAGGSAIASGKYCAYAVLWGRWVLVAVEC